MSVRPIVGGGIWVVFAHVCVCVSVCLFTHTLKLATPAALRLSFFSRFHGLWTRTRGTITNLDSIGFVTDVKHTLLNLVVNFFSSTNKGLFYVVSSLRGCFHEDKSVFLCKSFSPM